MSWRGSGIISRAKEVLVADYLATKDAHSACLPSQIASYCEVSEFQANALLKLMIEERIVRSEELAYCSECDQAVQSDDDADDATACDACGCESATRAKFYFVIDPSAFGVPSTLELPMPPLSFTPDLKREGRITPWAYLEEEQYLVSGPKMDDERMTVVRAKLEEFGFALLRLGSVPPDEALLRSVEEHLGDALETQNDSPGKVKTIRPNKDAPANTGDYLGPLGPHVDGTQEPVLPPAVLAFHYFAGATHGGMSTFFDAAHILSTLPDAELRSVLTSLAATDAGICEKTKEQKGGKPPWVGRYEGPLVKAVSDRAVSLRIRFDREESAVLKVKPQYQASLDRLAEAVMDRTKDQNLRLQFLPREADIAIFDNWRVLHGRGSLGGHHERYHARIWIKELAKKHRTMLGIRGLAHDLRHSIEQANQRTA